MDFIKEYEDSKSIDLTSFKIWRDYIIHPDRSVAAIKKMINLTKDNRVPLETKLGTPIFIYKVGRKSYSVWKLTFKDRSLYIFSDKEAGTSYEITNSTFNDSKFIEDEVIPYIDREILPILDTI